MRAFVWLTLAVTIACAGNEAEPEAERETALGFSLDSVSRDSLSGAGDVLTYGVVQWGDTTWRVKSFAAFRDTLFTVIAARDTTALFALLAPDIKSSFGGDEGLEGFRAHWELASGSTRLWTVLQDVLMQSGRFEGLDRYVAPYTYFGLPDSLDPYTHLIARKSAVRVFARADTTSRVVGILAYHVVRLADTLPPEPWVGIALKDSAVGFVQSEFVRSPLDYRITIVREDGRWRIIYFLAGD
ncbi:MAG: hypothetical protein IT357_02945 [Gemmatimonadaceae bacterium]|nr:hypothetical protein [Gemmatimonadaceae bacterium]